MTTDVYCAAPFRHLAISNNHYSDWQPCCTWLGELGTGIPRSEDPFNGPMMTDLRQRMLDGRGHPSCIRCYDNDKNGSYSNRAVFNDEYGRPETAMLTDIEFNLGNLCNMKCRMCSSVCSSKWIPDDKLFGTTTVTKVIRRTINDIPGNPADLTRIKFVGGEPTLEQDAIREILSEIERRRGSLSHLNVEVISNASVPFDDDLMDMFLRCKDLQITVSIDGMKVSHEYQRTGGDFDVAMDIARGYHDLGLSSPLKVNSTFSLLTIQDAMKLVDHVAINLPRAVHLISSVYVPEPLSPRNLPTSCKGKLMDEIQAWIPALDAETSEVVKSKLLFMLSMPPNSPPGNVREYLDILDSVRAESLANVLPDVYQAVYGNA